MPTKENTVKKKKVPLSPWLSKIDAPFHVDVQMKADGSFFCTVFGVSKINTFTQTEMSFSYKEGEVSFLGESLFCRTFLNKAVQIEGKVKEIVFKKGQQK